MAYTSKDRGFYKTMLGTSIYSGNTKTAQSGIGRKVISASKNKKSSFEDDFNERTIQKLKEEATPIKLPEIFSEGDSPKKAITVTSGKTQRNVFPDTNNSDVQESAVKEQISQGSKIRQTITDLLKNKYGEPDTKHLFDNIDDKDIEKNIPVAKNTIKTNVDMGKLEKDYPLKLPNLEDGLALSYAAADKGMNKAATRAREAAYMDGVSNTVRAVEDLLKKQTLESNVKVSNLLNKIDGSKTVSVENLAREGEAKGVRFRAEMQNGILKNNTYSNLKEALTKTDLDAGIKITKTSNGEYSYDYTDVIMNRVNEVLPDFLNHKIMSYPEYYKEYSNWLYSPTLQEYYAFCLNDYVFFFNQVNHGAPWDIKRDEPWKQQFGNIKMPYYDSNPNKDEKFLFRGELVTREALGNILYGYLGSAMGIGDTTLYQGGGIAADWKNLFDGDLFDESEFYGDNKHDHEYVKKGIRMFYEDYPEAKT